MSVELIQASARELPLADASVQCVVTSPPYWGLRKYAGEQELIWGGDRDCPHLWQTEEVIQEMRQGLGLAKYGQERGCGGGHKIGKLGTLVATRGECMYCGAWRGAFGLEPTVEMYVTHTVEILREIHRVLRSDGVCFWNIGDRYASSPSGNQIWKGWNTGGTKDASQNYEKRSTIVDGLKPKDLCLIPHRVALAAQADGWWVRSDIIWAKPNPMPESVKDRPTDSYEHVLMLAKSERYFWDAVAVMEPQTQSSRERAKYGWNGRVNDGSMGKRTGSAWQRAKQTGEPILTIPKHGMRNLRNVWTFATQPYKGAHFATFPEELPCRCIKAATRPGDLVLDPFAGSGTVGKVAAELGRRAVLVDIAYSPGGYLELARHEFAGCNWRSERRRRDGQGNGRDTQGHGFVVLAVPLRARDSRPEFSGRSVLPRGGSDDADCVSRGTLFDL